MSCLKIQAGWQTGRLSGRRADRQLGGHLGRHLGRVERSGSEGQQADRLANSQEGRLEGNWWAGRQAERHVGKGVCRLANGANAIQQFFFYFNHTKLQIVIIDKERN